MGLNIKNEETQRLIDKLAALTGESKTAAITKSVQERLNRLERELSREQRFEAMMKIAAEIRAGMDGPISSSDIDDLYDEDGLPR